jgi:hypothetical protein
LNAREHAETHFRDLYGFSDLLLKLLKRDALDVVKIRERWKGDDEP